MQTPKASEYMTLAELKQKHPGRVFSNKLPLEHMLFARCHPGCHTVSIYVNGTYMEFARGSRRSSGPCRSLFREWILLRCDNKPIKRIPWLRKINFANLCEEDHDDILTRRCCYGLKYRPVKIFDSALDVHQFVKS